MNRTPVIDPSQKVNYNSTVTPTNYVCHQCGVSGVKLWREYQTFLNNQSLLCVVCSGLENKKDINSINASGLTSQGYGKTDQLGFRIPAVLTEANDSYWGYTSVPDKGIQWWKNLPAFPDNKRKVPVGDFRRYLIGTPEYVYLHGIKMRKKGKNHSAILSSGNIRVTNPQVAFYLAKLLVSDTEKTLFGKPFLRSEINWGDKYEKHLEGPNAEIPFEPKGGIDECICSICFYRVAASRHELKQDCQMLSMDAKTHFEFKGIAKNLFLPPIVYGKDLGHYCPHWLNPNAE